MVALHEPEPFPTLGSRESVLARAPKRFKHGIDLTNAGDFEGALREYDAVLALIPNDPYVLTNRGAVLGKLGRHEEALAHYERALEQRSDHPKIRTNRGIALLSLGRDAGAALADFERSLAVRPDDPDTLFWRSAALARLQRYDEALRSINQYLALRPDDAEAQSLHRELLDKRLWELVDEGFAHWSGGKPKGSYPPIKITPGPPISDYVIEDRR